MVKNKINSYEKKLKVSKKKEKTIKTLLKLL